MSYYFECQVRRLWNNRTIIEKVDMDIFLEFLQDYHEEKWEKNNWEHIQMVDWIKLPLGSIEWRRKEIKKYKRYVEFQFEQLIKKKELYKAYKYYCKSEHFIYWKHYGIMQ